MTDTLAASKIRLRPLIAALVLSLVAVSFSATPNAAADASRLVSVIVRGLTGTADAAQAVESVGGSVTHELPIIDGVSGKVPETSIESLRATGRQVELDAKVGFHGEADGVGHKIQKLVRATKLWDEGVTGSGVTVALIDTGVYAAHPDLAGRVLHCEDFTAERYTEANCQDTFGHGTFMAGLIAGDGTSSNGKYMGAAPDANIVAVKAAGFDGSTDVSTILAAIQWTVAFKDTYGIRVMNLSLGTDAMTDYRLSLLNFAVERAWDAGITVVVSAGNTGPDSRTIMKPGDDPFVITVGASTDMGSMDIRDDHPADFSGRGPTRANGLSKPDIVSPGVRTISLRSPGSAIDQQFGSTAAIGEGYFRGTGTSMSTATVSGIVADMLQANPLLNPDQVKHRLKSTAREIADDDRYRVGDGLVDAYAATRSSSLREANRNPLILPSTGLGLLELDRGSLGVDVHTPAGSVALTGELTAQTNPEEVSLENPTGLVAFNGTQWHDVGWEGTQWHGTQWHAGVWSGTQWHGTQWHGTQWHGTQWHGTQWHNVDWAGTQWHGTQWHGTQWHGTQWHTAWYAVAWE